MKTTPRRLLSLFSTGGVPLGALAAAATLLLPSGARAANGSWSGGNGGNWNDSGNWAPGIPGATSGTSSTDVATFYGTPANRTIVVDAGRNIANIAFTSSATNFVIGSAGGNALTLTSGSNITYALNAATNLTQAVNAPLQLAGGYTLTNNNTMASGNVLSFGGLISSINPGATTLTITGSGKKIFSGGFSSGSGTMTVSQGASSGEIEINGGDSSIGRLVVGASSVTTISGGTLALTTPNSNFVSVGASGTLNITGGKLEISSAIGGNAFGGGGSVLQTGGTVALSGTGVTMANVSFGGVVGSYRISGGSYTTSGSTVLRGMGNFTADGTAEVNFNGPGNSGSSPKLADGDTGVLTVGGNANVTFANPLNLAAGATGKGTVNLDGGTLHVPNFAVGSGTSTINFNGGTLHFTSSGSMAPSQVMFANVKDGGARVDTGGNNVVFSQTLAASGTGGLTKLGSGTLTVSAANTYTGATQIDAGTLKAGSASSVFGNSTAVTLANVTGAILDLGNFNQSIGSLAGGGASGGNVVLGTGTLTVGGNNTSTSYAGVISGSGAVSKVGTGTLTIAGTQTYTGTTMVSVGTLIVNGQLGSGGVVVSGGKLGGNITVTGLTTIASGGTLAVGNSPGTGNFTTLNLSGAAATSVTEMQLNAGATGAGAGTTYDTINVSTALTYGGELRLVFNGAVGPDIFDLFNFGALTPGGDFGSVSLYANSTLIGALTENAGVWTGIYDLGLGSGSQSFTFTNASGDLVVAVPEPGTWLLFGLGLGVVLLRKRRAIR